MKPGEMVRYYLHDRGWHFGTLVKLGRKYAVILHPLKGRKKVPLVDVQRWAEV